MKASGSKLKVGIVGCGSAANRTSLPALKNRADLCEMVAFCDLIPERAIRACEEYGAPGAKAYADYRELLIDPAVDVVQVCVPDGSGGEIASAAFAARKPVYPAAPAAEPGPAPEALRILEGIYGTA